MPIHIESSIKSNIPLINLEGIGVIKEGYFADLVILNDNPLEDIKHTKEIHTIVKGGKVYTRGNT